jgi:ribosomal protein L37AE/L43A
MRTDVGLMKSIVVPQNVQPVSFKGIIINRTSNEHTCDVCDMKTKHYVWICEDCLTSLLENQE